MNKLGLTSEYLNRFTDNEVSPLVAFLSVPRSEGEINAFLAINGLDLKAVSKQGNTSLHLVVQNRISADNLKVLLEHEKVKEVINTRNNKGMTALDMAVDGRNNEFAKLLIDKGAQLGVFVVNQEEKEKGAKEQEPREQQVARSRGDLEDKIREFNKNVAAKLEDGERNRELDAKKRMEAERQRAQARRTAMMAEIQVAQDLHNESRDKLLKMKADVDKIKEDTEKQVELAKVEQVQPEQQVDPKQEEPKDVQTKQLQDLSKLLGQEITDFQSINRFLYDAAFRGDQNLTMQLITFGGDVNSVQNGKTVLEAACEGGNRSLVLTLCVKNPQAFSGAKDTVKESVNNISETVTRDIKTIDKLLESLGEVNKDLQNSLLSLKKEKQEILDKPVETVLVDNRLSSVETRNEGNSIRSSSVINKVLETPSIDKVIANAPKQETKQGSLEAALKEVGELFSPKAGQAKDNSVLGMKTPKAESMDSKVSVSKDDIDLRPSTSPKPIEAEKVKEVDLRSRVS